MLDQRSVLFVNSLEVPAGLQGAYVVFKWAVELEAFTGALNLQWAGWYRYMGVGLSINIIAHFGYILAIQNKVFVIWGARHSNILGTEQLINMAFRCIIPIPTQLTWCRKQATGTFHQDCSSEYVSLTALFTQVLEKLVILCKLKKTIIHIQIDFYILF